MTSGRIPWRQKARLLSVPRSDGEYCRQRWRQFSPAAEETPAHISRWAAHDRSSAGRHDHNQWRPSLLSRRSSMISSSASRSPHNTALRARGRDRESAIRRGVPRRRGVRSSRHLELRLPAAQRTYLREADAPQPPVSVVIIGVAPPKFDLGPRPGMMVYLPFRAEAPAAVALIVRGSGGSRSLVADIRDAVNGIDPDLALGVVRTLDELRDRSRADPADMASQFAKIGGLALVFSGVGLYSAMAYAVRRRTQEIAVRMALGAEATQVRWLFLKTGAWIITGGVIFGVPAALVVGRLLQNTFVRTESRDPVTLIVTVALLAIVALVASIVPAQRATRLEPTAALRIE